MYSKNNLHNRKSFVNCLKDLWYDAAIVIARLLLRFPLGYRIWVEGKENLSRGACIIAANHLSYLDPVFIVAGLNEKLYFLVKHYISPTEGFDKSLYGKFVRSIDQIIIKEDRINKYALEKSLSILGQDKKLAIFPEGTRSSDGKLKELEKGIALISDLSKKPIVPLYINGTFEIWPRHKKFPKLYGRIKIKIGKPLYLANIKDKKDRRNDLVDRVRQSFNLLKIT